MRQRLIIASCSLAALAFAAAPTSAQNKQIELEWLRLAGATFGGQVSPEGSGRAVASAGDVNGDGYDDLLVGAYTWDTPSVDDVGRVYLVYGGLNITGTQNLSAAGAIFEGEVNGITGWNTGFAVAGAGDVNNDGYDDILVGAPNAKTNASTGAGRVYLIWGGPALTGTFNLATFTGDVLINGVNASDLAGSALAGPGDVNGDGFDDLLIGANGADNGALNFTGAAYIVYGAASLPAVIDLATLGSGGVTIKGSATSERVGDAVGAGGDVNGDSFPDVLIGAQASDPTGKTDGGRAWIVYGGNAIPTTLTVNAMGSNGVIINGQAAGDRFGTKIEGGGDVNGDGRDDILVSGPLSDPAVGTGNDAGRVYLIYGSASFPGTIEATNIGTTVAGVVFTGIDGITTNPVSGDRAGSALAAGGDFNRDGFADLLIATGNGDPNGDNAAGEVYLIEGSASLPATFPLSAINARGTVLAGVDPSDTAGSAVCFAGDVNHDGFTDVLIGAPGGDPASGGTDAGESVLVYGTCHMIQAVGPVAEGGFLNLHAHGAPFAANATFATTLAIGQPPFGPAQPLATPFGPWWLISQLQLFSFVFGANGEMFIPLAMPAPGAVPGLLGLTVYMQVLGAPQGKKCDLTYLLGFTVQ